MLKCLCSCFSKKETPEEDPNNFPNTSPNQNIIPNSSPSQEPKSLKVIVDTKYQKEEIKVSDYTPANTGNIGLTYNCPICLRYFSTILTLKCCKQYICHYCISDLEKNQKFEVACPHCKAVPILASDVDFSSSVKRYSDSPYGTFKQSNKVGSKWVPMSVVEEDKDYEASQLNHESFDDSKPSAIRKMQLTV